MNRFKHKINNLIKMKYTPIVLLIIFNAFCIHLAIPKMIVVEGEGRGGSISVNADVSGYVDTGCN